MPETMPKLRRLADEARRRGSSVWLQVDGGIGASTIAQAAEAGADTFVAGSAVFGADDPEAAIAGLRARGTSDVQAAFWGTHLHAAAGDRLASRLGGLGYLARELNEELPPLMMELSA